MSIKLKPRHQKRASLKREGSALVFFKRVFQLTSGFGVLFAILTFSIWCLDPKTHPISAVRLTGDRVFLSEEDLRDIISPQLKSGFFALKVSVMQAQLLRLPWVKQASIKKVWPNQLEVRFEEHIPAALWGTKGVLSNTGTLFFPHEPKKVFQKLPILYGPEGRHPDVWSQFLEIEKILSPVNLQVTELVLAPRGAWHLKLSNDITVILGTNDIMSRLARFVRAYQKQLGARQTELASVDLRYTSGMAISWKAS